MNATEKKPGAESLRRRPCPLCNCHETTLLLRQQFAQLSAGALLGMYDVVICKACGFGYADGIPDQVTFDRYYRDMSKYEYGHRAGREPDWVLDRYRATADLAEPFLPSKSVRILDVGCATGGMLAEFRNRGFPNVLGYDPSPGCAEAAKRLYGIEVVPRNLSDLSGAERQFDLVLLTGVLEHVPDLAPALDAVFRATADGGAVLIAVPDATDFSRWPNAPFQEFSTEHVNFFSPRSLENLMHRHGFVEIASRRTRGELSRDAVEPVVESLFRKVSESFVSTERDADTERGLREYINTSQAVIGRVDDLIEDLRQSNRPVIIWGVGTHTLRLLATGGLAALNIASFVDSNVKYGGKTLRGIKIIGPQDLPGRNEPILISSYVYQEEIANTIISQLNLKNELIRLYETRATGAM